MSPPIGSSAPPWNHQDRAGGSQAVHCAGQKGGHEGPGQPHFGFEQVDAGEDQLAETATADQESKWYRTHVNRQRRPDTCENDVGSVWNFHTQQHLSRRHSDARGRLLEVRGNPQ